MSIVSIDADLSNLQPPSLTADEAPALPMKEWFPVLMAVAMDFEYVLYCLVHREVPASRDASGVGGGSGISSDDRASGQACSWCACTALLPITSDELADLQASAAGMLSFILQTAEDQDMEYHVDVAIAHCVQLLISVGVLGYCRRLAGASPTGDHRINNCITAQPAIAVALSLFRHGHRVLSAVERDICGMSAGKLLLALYLDLLYLAPSSLSSSSAAAGTVNQLHHVPPVSSDMAVDHTSVADSSPTVSIAQRCRSLVVLLADWYQTLHREEHKSVHLSTHAEEMHYLPVPWQQCSPASSDPKHVATARHAVIPATCICASQRRCVCDAVATSPLSSDEFARQTDAAAWLRQPTALGLGVEPCCGCDCGYHVLRVSLVDPASTESVWLREVGQCLSCLYGLPMGQHSAPHVESEKVSSDDDGRG